MAGKRRSSAGLVLLSLLLVPLSGDAQTRRYRGPGPGGALGVSLEYAEARGDFGTLVDDAWGVGLHGRYDLEPSGAIGLRADFGFLNYGRETLHYCSPLGCRVGYELTTRNDIMHAAIGPQLSLPTRSPIRPYVHAGIGVSYFSTSSGISGDYTPVEFARSENFSDAVLTWTAGVGTGVSLRAGRHPIELDLGWTFRRNGEVDYLVEGSIVDHPDGSITIYPNRSEVELGVLRLGVSVGLGGGGDEPWDDDRCRGPRCR